MSSQITKTAGIILSLFLLTACNPGSIEDVETESNRIEGEQVRGYVPAYNEMCLREPESKLCKKESAE